MQGSNKEITSKGDLAISRNQLGRSVLFCSCYQNGEPAPQSTCLLVERKCRNDWVPGRSAREGKTPQKVVRAVGSNSCALLYVVRSRIVDGSWSIRCDRVCKTHRRRASSLKTENPTIAATIDRGQIKHRRAGTRNCL